VTVTALEVTAQEVDLQQLRTAELRDADQRGWLLSAPEQAERRSPAACLMAAPPRRPHLAPGGAAAVPLERVQPTLGAMSVIWGTAPLNAAKQGKSSRLWCSAKAVVNGARQAHIEHCFDAQAASQSQWMTCVETTAWWRQNTAFLRRVRA
jgi:hypothetical protein